MALISVKPVKRRTEKALCVKNMAAHHQGQKIEYLHSTHF